MIDCPHLPKTLVEKYRQMSIPPGKFFLIKTSYPIHAQSSAEIIDKSTMTYVLWSSQRETETRNMLHTYEFDFLSSAILEIFYAMDKAGNAISRRNPFVNHTQSTIVDKIKLKYKPVYLRYDPTEKDRMSIINQVASRIQKLKHLSILEHPDEFDVKNKLSDSEEQQPFVARGGYKMRKVDPSWFINLKK